MGDTHRDTMRAIEETKCAVVVNALNAHLDVLQQPVYNYDVQQIVRCLEQNWGSYVGPREPVREGHDH